METIFGHHPTPDELAILTGDGALPVASLRGDGGDYTLARLADLASLRGDFDRAAAYVARITDAELRETCRQAIHGDVFPDGVLPG